MVDGPLRMRRVVDPVQTILRHDAGTVREITSQDFIAPQCGEGDADAET